MDATTVKTEAFTLTWNGPCEAAAFREAIGRINAATWRGHPPGCVLFSGLKLDRSYGYGDWGVPVGSGRVDQEMTASFVVRKGCRWDEFIGADGRWFRIDAAYRETDFNALPIPAAAEMSEPVAADQVIVPPAGAGSWRDRTPLL